MELEGLELDLLAIGRSSMDLFSVNVGAPFMEIEGFSAHVGGSPTNIAIASSRLGLRVALLTAVGDDPVGAFVLHHLEQEGVNNAFIPFKAERRTSLAVLGIEPPDKFPLVFYRENPPDSYIDIDDIHATPIGQCRAVLLSGTALSRGRVREATFWAAEVAQASGVTTYIDLDLRPDQWSHPRAFGANIRAIMPLIDVVIGTEEELYAALSSSPEEIMGGAPVPDKRRKSLEGNVWSLLSRPLGPEVVVIKRGPAGVNLFSKQEEPREVAGFPVEVVNTVGAGDAFAGGLIHGRLRGWDWYKSARFGNACGALVVTRHGCSAAMPYEREVLDFVAENGGF